MMILPKRLLMDEENRKCYRNQSIIPHVCKYSHELQELQEIQNLAIIFLLFINSYPPFCLLLSHLLFFRYPGSLIQVPMSEKGKITRGRLGSLSLKKEGERQCFLFSKHLIICTRGSGGKLHLTKVRAHKSQKSSTANEIGNV